MSLGPLPLLVVPGLLQLVSAGSTGIPFGGKSVRDLGAKLLPVISDCDRSSDCLTADGEERHFDRGA